MLKFASHQYRDVFKARLDEEMMKKRKYKTSTQTLSSGHPQSLELRKREEASSGEH